MSTLCRTILSLWNVLNKTHMMAKKSFRIDMIKLPRYTVNFPTENKEGWPDLCTNRNF